MFSTRFNICWVAWIWNTFLAMVMCRHTRKWLHSSNNLPSKSWLQINIWHASVYLVITLIGPYTEFKHVMSYGRTTISLACKLQESLAMGCICSAPSINNFPKDLTWLGEEHPLDLHNTRWDAKLHYTGSLPCYEPLCILVRVPNLNIYDNKEQYGNVMCTAAVMFLFLLSNK